MRSLQMLRKLGYCPYSSIAYVHMEHRLQPVFEDAAINSSSTFQHSTAPRMHIVLRELLIHPSVDSGHVYLLTRSYLSMM